MLILVPSRKWDLGREKIEILLWPRARSRFAVPEAQFSKFRFRTSRRQQLSVAVRSQKSCCGQRYTMICNIVVKLEKQRSTTTVQWNHVPEAQFSKFCFRTSRTREFYKANNDWHMASPVLTLCLQEAKRASGATFIVKFWFRAKKKESAAKDLISICQLVNLAESAKMHATQKSKFRRPSRYLERARTYCDREWVLPSYACRCFSAWGDSTHLRSGQRKKLSKLLTKGLVLTYIYI